MGDNVITAALSPRKDIAAGYRIFACLVLGATASAALAVADDRPDRDQAEDQDAAASSTNNSSNSSVSRAKTGANQTAGSDAPAHPSAEGLPGKVESAIFSSFFMAGKTQDQFRPLTRKERLIVYAKGFFSPFHLLMAGIPAAETQLQDVPKEWGLGAEGYARRYASYYGYTAVRGMLQMAGEDLLHEDNLYYGSGERGFRKRVKYALKSSILARSDDGSQHVSASQVGSTAAAAFISRLWQPRSTGSAGDGAVSFGISMATNAGVNLIREFLPDVTRHVFHANEGR